MVKDFKSKLPGLLGNPTVPESMDDRLSVSARAAQAWRVDGGGWRVDGGG